MFKKLRILFFGERKHYQQSPNKGDLVLDTGLAILSKVLFAYLICILFISIPGANSRKDKPFINWMPEWLANIGTISLICGASLLCGSFLGFLFGIPRSLRSDSPAIHNANNEYSDNTNLEQISDWLTKIIVGVSLIELREIRTGLDQIAHNCSKALLFSLDNGYVIAFSSILMFSISGFLFCYLWTRVRLKQVFTGLDKSLDEIKGQINEISKRNIDKLMKLFREWEEKILPVNLRNLLPEITIEDDPQKGRFGGLATVGDYSSSAVVTPVTPELKFDVEITVTTPANDTSPIYFYLHDSFNEPIIKVEPKNNKAILKISAYEAFTVGMICNEGKVLLESDLNLITAPAGFKY